MQRNITVLMSIFIALILSLSTTYVLTAKGDYNDNWNGNTNNNFNGNNNQNGNGNTNGNDNGNANDNDNSNDNGNGNSNDNGVEIYGTISSIDYNNMRFVMTTQYGQIFSILGNTALIKAEHTPCPLPTFNDLQVGHQVKAEGWWNGGSNGAVQAYEVEVYNYTCSVPGPGGVIVTVKGKVSSITPDSNNPEEGELVVTGETIEVSSSTKFKGTTTSFSGLSVGQKITAKGKLQTDGKIKARNIKTK